MTARGIPCRRGLTFPHACLPNILLGDLVNLRKEFLMRKSRPSITNETSVALLPFVRPRSSTSSDSARILDAGQIAKFLADIVSTFLPFSSGHIFPPRPAPSLSCRNFLAQIGLLLATLLRHRLSHSSIRRALGGGGGAGQLLTSLILNYGMDYSKSSIDYGDQIPRRAMAIIAALLPLNSDSGPPYLSIHVV